MYYGWPYYAWSAGHDTYTRDTIYLWLITGCGGDIDEFTETIWNALNEQNKISLYVRFVDLATGEAENRMINKHLL